MTNKELLDKWYGNRFQFNDMKSRTEVCIGVFAKQLIFYNEDVNDFDSVLISEVKLVKHPRVFYLNETKEGLLNYAYFSKEDAIEHGGRGRLNTIKFIEVIE